MTFDAEHIPAPWLSSYGSVPAHLDYPDITMFEMLEEIAKKHPDFCAYDFMGTKVTYKKFIADILDCAKAFKTMGIRPGDRVTICMPNTPQAVTAFYALNVIGALSNMIHPLSAEGEIAFYLNYSKSVAILTLNAFYNKIANIRRQLTTLKHVIVATIQEELNPVLKLGFMLTKGRKIPPIPADADVIWYRDFITAGKKYTGDYRVAKKGADAAVILYSGGTTGTTKGILLSNLCFNALSMQTFAAGGCINPGDSMLSVMPVFHGFGLGVCIHTALTNGCKCILVPQFNAQSYAKLLKKQQPNVIAGVPTLFEALLRNKYMDGVDLSCLKGIFSGGDSLSIELKKKVDKFLRDHGSKEQVREGYGLTECVTASCLTPRGFYKEGSIGVPFPDTYYKIVKPGTKVTAAYKEEGEICISGPSVMIEYLDNPAETADCLQIHEDGLKWLHTGDLGTMDPEGFVYFRQRLKRMIISSGYSIYPSQLENIIDAHECVLMSTVIGVPDPYKVQKVKAFIVLKPGCEPTDEIKSEIYDHCVKNIAKYAMPYEIEYRKSLPQTLVGKVAYKVLEQEETEKLTAASAH